MDLPTKYATTERFAENGLAEYLGRRKCDVCGQQVFHVFHTSTVGQCVSCWNCNTVLTVRVQYQKTCPPFSESDACFDLTPLVVKVRD